ncbi:CoA transferase [Yinghuangia aomiensis]
MPGVRRRRTRRPAGRHHRRAHEAPGVDQRVRAALLQAALAMDVGAGMAALEAQRVPCGRVLAPAELPDDPHAVAVGLFEESVHAKAGRLRMPRHPARFAGTPAALGAPSPLLGEHTDEVLAELGMADRITALRAAGVVG